MDTGYRLRMKIGEHEFEAQGSERSVKEQFEQFKALIGKSSTAPLSASDSHHKTPLKPTDSRLQVLFDNDEKRRLVTLKKKPLGLNATRDTALLILYGFRVLRQENDVPGIALKSAIELTGFKVKRLDRFLSSCTREQLVIPGGKGKGSRYGLTNTGLERAQIAMDGILKQVA